MIDLMKSEVSSVITTVSLGLFVPVPDGVHLPTPGCGELILFSSLDHRGLVITGSLARSARAYIVGFEDSMSPLVKAQPRVWELGKHGECHGIRWTWGSSPAAITWSGQMNPQNGALPGGFPA